MIKKIVTLTVNPSIDISSSIENLMANRKLRCTQPGYEPGGGGINVSRAIKRLGGKSIAVYTSGGENGKRFQNLLSSEGIENHPVKISGMTRESFVVYDESNSQQYRFVMPGPALSEREWKSLLDALFTDIIEADYIVASGSLPPGVPADFYSQVVSRASKKGIRTIIDTSGEALGAATQSGVYLIKPNLNELRALAGQEIENDPQMIEAAKKIIDSGGCEVVIVSLGPAGVLMVSKGGHERISAPIVKIKSRVGAGDSMVAGIVLSLSQGKSLRDAVLFGVASGTAAVITPGTELCRKENALKLYKQLTAEHSKNQ